MDSLSPGASALGMLQRQILSGELRAGEWLLPERELAEKMGVSRGALHQAIVSLENQGFVSIIPRRGTVVKDYRKHPTPQILAVIMNYNSAELDKSIFSDMMDFRVWLETECARLACRNIYDSTLEEMRDVVREIRKEKAELAALTCRFHYLLCQASGNAIFSMMFRSCEPVILSLTEQRYRIEREDVELLTERMTRLIHCIKHKREQEAADTVAAMLRHGIGYLEARYE